MDNGRHIGESHADIGKKDIAPVTVLPFSFDWFYSESIENLVKSAHFLLIEWRKVKALADPEFHTGELFRIELIGENQLYVRFLLFVKIEQF